MKLAEFLVGEELRLRYFAAYWRENMRVEALTGGNADMPEGCPQWPDEMDAGLWDEMLGSFAITDAQDIGIYLDGDRPDPEGIDHGNTF